MKKFFAVLALVAMIAVPTFAQSASAATVSPSSSSFGDNGY
jgi:Tfp pilus assembly protein FimT